MGQERIMTGAIAYLSIQYDNDMVVAGLTSWRPGIIPNAFLARARWNPAFTAGHEMDSPERCVLQIEIQVLKLCLLL